MDGLKEVSDCIRKVMQKQSVSWSKHKHGEEDDNLNSGRRGSVKKHNRNLSK